MIKLWEQSSLWSVLSLSYSSASDMTKLSMNWALTIKVLYNTVVQHCRSQVSLKTTAQASSWWMILTVSAGTLSSISPQWETISRGQWPCWPAPLWCVAERGGLWSQSWDSQEKVGVLWNSDLPEGFWQHATLTCQWKSLAGWNCSAGRRPGATALWHEPVPDSTGRRTSAETSSKPE